MKAKLKILNILKSKSEKETFSLAKNFSKNLKGGEIILLKGPIGAGKTIFTKGLAKGLKCLKEPISSTFNIMRIYEGKLNLVHFDLFRFDNFEFDQIIDYLEEKSILVIEWPNGLNDLYKRFKCFEIEIKLIKKDYREIIIRG